MSEITAYARVGDSQIVYQISGEEYETLMAASYNDLRHTQVFWADFDGVSQLDIALDGVDYTITSKGDGEDRLWFYGDEELDITNLQRALEGVTAVGIHRRSRQIAAGDRTYSPFGQRSLPASSDAILPV